MTRKTLGSASPNGTEIELKLALAAHEPAELARRLSRAAVLKRRQPLQQQLHNIYFDTPTQQLRRARAALRLRRVDAAGGTRWLQTLKTGAAQEHALSQRGEWETPVAGAALQSDALDARAWARIDPDGRLFRALAPCFVTDFTRTIWRVRRRDGSVVEVALDIGSVTQGERSAPICELELELKAGPVAALFDVAEKIAATVPAWPSGMSKAQRGYALAADAPCAPTMSTPPRLSRGMPVRDAARRLLREMFGQFSAHLNTVYHGDDPEVVHQARVAWRRLHSTLRLFRSVLPEGGPPDWTALKPLQRLLGGLRDLDVARTHTLPPLRDAFVAGSADRAQAWDATMDALQQAGHAQRSAVRQALQDPSVGLCLLQAVRWLEPAATPADTQHAGDRPLARWARRHTTKLHARLKRARRTAHDARVLHKVRLLAKRTRYAIEALHRVLPQHMRHKWHRAAVELQQRIGAERDLAQAIGLLARIEAPDDLTAYLRGVVAGRSLR